jgi:hypothetical protein
VSDGSTSVSSHSTLHVLVPITFQAPDARDHPHKRSPCVGYGLPSLEMNACEHGRNLRQSRRWGVAAATSTCICVLWFAYLNRDGCWLYFRGTGGLIVFVLPWLWLMLLFGLRMKARLVLGGLTLVGLIFLPQYDTFPGAAAEVCAVVTLRQLRSRLESYRVGEQEPSYPRTLPNVDSCRLRSAYRFHYVPSFSANGTIDAYMIEATPVRRICGCKRSFTVTDDDRWYATLEDRAATVSDEPLR